MEQCNPVNRGLPNYAYINGTLHGNPIGCAAGLATLDVLRQPGFYPALRARAEQVQAACQEVLDRHGLPARVIGKGSLWQIVFMKDDPTSYADFIAADMARTRALDHRQLFEGIYVLPGVRRFVSAVHTDRDVADTVSALDTACRVLADGDERG